uniref:Essential protein Yae1 N-terminal domain-containing protein n=1 Tax=Aegilops tauschii subsp. strangulata TaxID=200361 RepID=A0A453GJY8_AEGTS
MDFLEPMIALDETHYQDGYKDGYDDGMVSGKEEGRQVGLKLGFQVGEELGFYQGCLDVWMSIIRLDQGHDEGDKAEIQGYHGKLRSKIGV